MNYFRILLIAALTVAGTSFGDEPSARTVEQIAREARQSLAIITVNGRDGAQQGIGAGFVIDAKGLIATNLHVVGESRPISVQLADGRKFDVTEIHASDSGQDLAIVRVAAEDLVPLALGDSDAVEPGRAVVVMGNPHGLAHSVVSGVVSGRREIDGRKMLQLALPIEPGNSGGPVLDMEGRVLGVVTMKSAVTDNLGFAVESSAVRTLLEKPNPIPMDRWLTIGALDRREWSDRFGARWRHDAGQIVVEGSGEGFGGRSLCLREANLPPRPYEVGVWVKLNDEAGAAGLALDADEGDRHYGFYPSNGRLRFTRFDGPDVFSWQVLREEPSEHYVPGQWNHLKVRVEEGKFTCFVNDREAFQITDDELPAGKLGLAKFRDTVARFKQFRVAEKLPATQLDETLAARLTATIEQLPELRTIDAADLDALAEDADASRTLLRKSAEAMERRARELRSMAGDLHSQRVAKELGELLSQPEERIDLAKAALLIARLDDEELDIDAYLRQIDRLANELREKIPPEADAAARREALHEYLFREHGFHGGRFEYYHRANSYLNRVLEDREGLPITLSVLYLEVGRRAGLQLEGVGLPGHFVVKQITPEGEQLIDVFDRGALLSREDAEKIVLGAAGGPLDETHLAATAKKAIILRMLGNLMGLAQSKSDREAMLRYLEAWLAIDPEAIPERGMRAIVRFETGRRDAAIADIDIVLDGQPEGIDLDRLRQMRKFFLRSAP